MQSAGIHSRSGRRIEPSEKLRQKEMMKIFTILLATLALAACGKGSASTEAAETPSAETTLSAAPFDADSAYAYVERQVAFGPRVPGTEAHRRAGEWLAAELRRHGAEVILQKTDLTAFDGTRLPAVNIFGRFNPEASQRILLLAHWDCRPWADKDPDPTRRKEPVDGANDGASGVGVLLEIARQLGVSDSGKGVDILFVDAEDWGTDNNENSWALGTRYFVENPPVDDYRPHEAILLDMVGGEGARFCREYFSQQTAPALNDAIWRTGSALGYNSLFINRMGGAVTDDHIQLIEHGIPAIDIIEFNPDAESGFNPRWHTTSDNMEGIDRATLKAVGETVATYLRDN